MTLGNMRSLAVCSLAVTCELCRCRIGLRYKSKPRDYKRRDWD